MEKPAGRKARSCREDGVGRGITILECQADGQPEQPVWGDKPGSGGPRDSLKLSKPAPCQLLLTHFHPGEHSPLALLCSPTPGRV